MAQPISKQSLGRDIHDLAFEYLTLSEDPNSKIWGDWKQEVRERMTEIEIDITWKVIEQMRETLKMVGL